MSNLNPLLLENWTVTKVDPQPPRGREKRHTIIYAEYDLPPDSCPKCGSFEKFEKWARDEQTFNDTPAWGGTVEIKVRRLRYLCPACRKTFMQPLPDMAPGYELTERCAIYIAGQGIQGVYAAVGRNVGVNEKTVRKLVKTYGTKALAQRGITAPVILGIDELTLLDERRCIFTNVSEREVIDLLPNMSSKSVRLWLWGLPYRDRVKIVTIDMWEAYRDAAYDTLPNAMVVVDKWHIQKKAVEALDRVRNRLAREAMERVDGESKYATRDRKKARQKALRGRRLLLKRNHKLTWLSRQVLNGWLAAIPVLKAAYEAKEAFYNIWEAKDRGEAQQRYADWVASVPRNTIPEFVDTMGTVATWREEIFRYFDAPFTNAYTEAQNGLIKHANRAGRSYAFENIRMKALLREVIYPLELFVCESCLGQFHKSELVQSFTSSVLPKAEGPVLKAIKREDLTWREKHLCVRCAPRIHVLPPPVQEAAPTG